MKTEVNTVASGNTIESGCPPSNENLLQTVLNGGIWFSGNCGINFPTFTPPIIDNGILSFQSMAAYDSFSKAIGIMEDFWTYSGVNYEDTPGEIYHLGEESLNAFDSAMGFQSLRHRYEVNEFYNYDWSDTAAIYVEDDNYQSVLNENREVIIGDKFYKYVATNIIARILKTNTSGIEDIRRNGIFAKTLGIIFFNEETGTNVNVEDNVEAGCGRVDLYVFGNNLTPTSTTNQWTVEAIFSGYYTIGLDDIPPSVLADYIINWGDGTTESFRSTFKNPPVRRHVYSQTIAPGNNVQKTISVTCTVVNPDPGLLFYCPNITSVLFTATGNVTLSTPTVDECLSKNIKRKFYSAQLTVGRNTYRLHCKLKQKSDPFIGFSHVTATAIFEKQKSNGSWKKVKPINSMTLNLKGKIYNDYSCDNEFKTMNHTKTTDKKTKLKIKDDNVASSFRSRKSLPKAINADFIWTHNNGQTSVGTYNERLKP